MNTNWSAVGPRTWGEENAVRWRIRPRTTGVCPASEQTRQANGNDRKQRKGSPATCFHRALSLLSPHRPSFVGKYPQVKWSSLSPRSSAEGPPSSVPHRRFRFLLYCSLFYSCLTHGGVLHKIMHMKNNVLVFHFFCFLFFLRVPHDGIFNMTTKIWMWSFWKFSKILQGSKW
jgi:hypothetical protein